jgi:hypothetical protein
MAEAMLKTAATKREVRRKLKPDEQVEMEKERDLARRREQLTKAKERFRTATADIAELEAKLEKTRAQQKEHERVVRDTQAKVKQLYEELGRSPEQDDNDDHSSEKGGLLDEDEDDMQHDVELDGLKVACTTRRTRWSDDELRDEYASVASGGSAANGRRTGGDGRSRSPHSRVGGVERNL